MTWTERDDTHTAKVGGYTLRVWQSMQYQTYPWAIIKGHMVKAGDAKSLKDAKKAAEAAIEMLRKE